MILYVTLKTTAQTKFNKDFVILLTNRTGGEVSIDSNISGELVIYSCKIYDFISYDELDYIKSYIDVFFHQKNPSIIIK